MQNGPESEKGSDNFIGPETKKILNGPGVGSTDSRKGVIVWALEANNVYAACA